VYKNGHISETTETTDLKLQILI